MTLNIPISAEIEARLRAQATASGTDLTTFVLHALEEKLSNTNGGVAKTQDARLKGWENFVSAMNDWTKTLPSGRYLDDSRDSIYESRGE